MELADILERRNGTVVQATVYIQRDGVIIVDSFFNMNQG